MTDGDIVQISQNPIATYLQYDPSERDVLSKYVGRYGIVFNRGFAASFAQVLIESDHKSVFWHITNLQRVDVDKLPQDVRMHLIKLKLAL